MKTRDSRIFDIVFVGVLAAMVYVVTLFRFPLLGSKVHFANAMCLRTFYQCQVPAIFVSYTS